MFWSWEKEHASAVHDLIRYSALAYEGGLVSAAGGNFSVRLSEDRFLVTGSNISLREVTPDSLVLCDGSGRVIEGNPHLRPSKETAFHLAVYCLRPEIRYILHTHPNYSVIWSLGQKELPMLTVSAQLKLRQVPRIGKADPGSKELSDLVSEKVRQTPMDIRAFLMEAHGILTLGETAEECFETAELLEDTAKVAVFRELLGKPLV